VISLAFLFIGAVIIWRKATTWIGLFVSFFLINFGALGISQAHVSALNTVQADSGPVFLARIMGIPLFLLAYPCLAFFFFTFPDGHLVPRWSWVLINLWVMNTFFFLVPVNPLNINYWPLWLQSLELFAVYGGSASTQLYRFLKVASPLQRQQIKWLLYGFAPVLLLPVCFGFASTLYPVPSTLGLLLGAIGQPLWRLYFLPLPLCIGIALLRYRLWDIDIVISRTLVYSTLTVSVVGFYVLVVVGLGSLIQASGNLLLSLLATGLIAVLFQPARARLQQAVNRLLYGERDEPSRVLTHLGQRLEATLTPEAVLPAIVETVAQALKLPAAAIRWAAAEGGSEPYIGASYGDMTVQPPQTCVPLVYQQETVGELVLALRKPGEFLTTADQRFLRHLAPQIGVAVHAVRLTADLKQLNADLQRSRTQLVTAREEERRRLRRDLHDGFGSVLASLNWRAGALRPVLHRDPVAAEALVVELQHTIQAAIGDIRRLVYNLRPPALDELGLIGALHEQAVKLRTVAERDRSLELQVEVCVPETLPLLPAAVEVAAYRIIQEALTNIARHAHANHCSLLLSCTEELLEIDILDDGGGLPAAHHIGVGLLSMRERAAELGGSCEVQRVAEGGTRVHAALPLLKDEE
jgi:signal transduction histidine kinase